MNTKEIYLESIGSLQKMIDAELIAVVEDEDGVDKLILTLDTYDAFFFSDIPELPENIRWHIKIWLYFLVMLRRACNLFHKTDRIDEKIRSYFRTYHWFDERKALNFLDKVRFFINWRRGYVAGLRNYGREDITPEEEKDILHKLRIPDTEWITFYVVNSDYEPIVIGRWIKDKFELKPWDSKH